MCLIGDGFFILSFTFLCELFTNLYIKRHKNYRCKEINIVRVSMITVIVKYYRKFKQQIVVVKSLQNII